MIPSISTIPIQQLASGDRLSIQVYKFIGHQPGKRHTYKLIFMALKLLVMPSFTS
jgi:hypothetical protein